jgi:coatomer subunit beta'
MLCLCCLSHTSHTPLTHTLSPQLNRLDEAHRIARDTDGDTKWKTLGDLALRSADIPLAAECFGRVKDLSSLLLLVRSTPHRYPAPR